MVDPGSHHDDLTDEVDRIFPDEPFRGIKQTRPIGADPAIDKRPFLYVVSYTNAPAALIEIGFIDNAGDRAKMLDPDLRKAACKMIADAITNAT